MGSRVLFMLPALALALLALVLAIVGLSRDPATPAGQPSRPSQADAAKAAPSYRYWVVMQPASTGETLSQEKLAVVTATSPIAGAVAADTSVADKPVQRFVRPGELLTQDILEPGGSLQAALPDGFRAMAIPVDDVTGAGGLLQPGDLVDVVSAFRRSDQDKPVALVMLRRVPVLAVRGVLSQGADPAGEENRRRNNTVVLSVPEARIPALMLASAEGSLRLAVVGGEERNAVEDPLASADPSAQGARQAPDDTPDNDSVAAITAAQPFYFDDFFPEKEKPKAAAPAPRRSPGQRVQIFEGSESRSTYVR
ncbi:Flp pilus assembly protein CpaB [Alloalcanivorax mobilis]|uniref:Flp pilus assembly protein CpaB n=1 Tax=Alloalcanivorax mobilis TaxID=2019569 RepID=UPI000C78205C|nr:Flp pilus assembly protein CpaB [Alloalcanivorax mobilis]